MSGASGYTFGMRHYPAVGNGLGGLPSNRGSDSTATQAIAGYPSVNPSIVRITDDARISGLSLLSDPYLWETDNYLFFKINDGSADRLGKIKKADVVDGATITTSSTTGLQPGETANKIYAFADFLYSFYAKWNGASYINTMLARNESALPDLESTTAFIPEWLVKIDRNTGFGVVSMASKYYAVVANFSNGNATLTKTWEIPNTINGATVSRSTAFIDSANHDTVIVGARLLIGTQCELHAYRINLDGTSSLINKTHISEDVNTTSHGNGWSLSLSTGTSGLMGNTGTWTGTQLAHINSSGVFMQIPTTSPVDGGGGTVYAAFGYHLLSTPTYRQSIGILCTRYPLANVTAGYIGTAANRAKSFGLLSVVKEIDEITTIVNILCELPAVKGSNGAAVDIDGIGMASNDGKNGWMLYRKSNVVTGYTGIAKLRIS